MDWWPRSWSQLSVNTAFTVSSLVIDTYGRLDSFRGGYQTRFAFYHPVIQGKGLHAGHADTELWIFSLLSARGGWLIEFSLNLGVLGC